VPDAHCVRAKSYKAFKSVAECLVAGGRLRKGIYSNTLSDTSALAETGYSRDRFGNDWADVDGDCEKSRAEALIEQSTTQVRFADERRCRVVTGRWISPFTGMLIHNAASTRGFLVQAKPEQKCRCRDWPCYAFICERLACLYIANLLILYQNWDLAF
jgi:hypothetical protein